MKYYNSIKTAPKQYKDMGERITQATNLQRKFNTMAYSQCLSLLIEDTASVINTVNSNIFWMDICSLDLKDFHGANFEVQNIVKLM